MYTNSILVLICLQLATSIQSKLCCKRSETIQLAACTLIMYKLFLLICVIFVTDAMEVPDNDTDSPLVPYLLAKVQ